MAENCFIDTWSWIEYFKGSESGKKLENLLKKEEFYFYTTECTVAEVRSWTLEESKDFEKSLSVIKSNSTIIPTFGEEWISAAEERFEKRKKIKDFGIIDAMLVVKQKRIGGKIITGDKHFKTLKNIIFIGD